jgi:hypothetical protein
VKGDYAGRPDDRWIFSTTNPYLQWNAIAALGLWLAWNDETAHPTPNPPRDSSGASRVCELGCGPRRS